MVPRRPPPPPGPKDLNHLSSTISTLNLPASPTIAILGATVEYTQLTFPPTTRLLALDHSEAMLQMLRATHPFSQREKVAAYSPTDEGERAKTSSNLPPTNPTPIAADWQNLPLPSASLDLTLTDGGFSILPYALLPTVAAELTRTLKPDAHLLLRLYTPTAQAESPAQVLHALTAGHLQDLNEFKLRIWLALNALNPSTSTGISVATIYSLFTAHVPSLQSLASKLNWPLEHLQVIEAYKNSPARYYFPTISEVLSAFPAFTLKNTTITDPRFPQCPTLHLQRNR